MKINIDKIYKYGCCHCPDGGMVDTGDLKSPGYCSRAGSSPVPGTTKYVVPSPSGKAAACKAAIPGSNPGGTSIFCSIGRW